MRLVYTGLGAGVIVGMLIMSCLLPYFSSEADELRRRFFTGVGLGVGIGFSTTLAVMVFNWFIGVMDRIKSGKF